jgi:hypothetical protein
MDIRIIKSELHTTASKDLNINEDLTHEDQNLEETLKAYENKKQELNETKESI